MEPPEKLSPEEFQAVVQKYLDEKCKLEMPDQIGRWECRTCGSTIQSAEVAASEHIKLPGISDCAGLGPVKVLVVPFCPTCEGPPKRRSTCIHV